MKHIVQGAQEERGFPVDTEKILIVLTVAR